MMYGYNELKDKELILCGDEKFSADVRDFFDGLRVRGIEDAAAIRPKEGQVAVVCSFEPGPYVETLERNGLGQGEDYILGEELIRTIDETETWFVAEYAPGRKAIVWGTGSGCEELVRENPHLEMAYFVEDERAGETLSGKEVRAVSALEEEEPGSVIVIGTPGDISEIPAMKRRLQEIGLVFGEDFYFYGDQQMVPDYTPGAETERAKRLAKGRKLIVMGVGWYCTQILQNNPELPAAYFIDNYPDRVGAVHSGKPVRGVDALLNEEPGSFLVMVTIWQHAAEVKRQLAAMGLIQGEDYYFCGKAESPSELLRQTIAAKAGYQLTCDVNGRGANVNASGGLEPCCKCASIATLGNVCYIGYRNVLRSLNARILHLSAVNRTFPFCTDMCWVFRNAAALGEGETIGRDEKPLPEKQDYALQLSYDSSCNLSCVSCRRARQTKPNGNPDVLAMIHEETLAVLTPDMMVRVGYGEALYSRYYREVLLERHSGEELRLTTNGLLLDAAVWETLRSRYRSIVLSISMDAATKQTFERVRGGNFDVLIKNLTMLGQARGHGELAKLVLNFTVQRDNFREMVEFARLAASLHADEIFLTRVQNWGTWSEKEFREIDVFDPANPFHPELIEILRDSVLQDKRVHMTIPQAE